MNDQTSQRACAHSDFPPSAGAVPALAALLEAHLEARAAEQSPWEYAIELHCFLTMEGSLTCLRRLVKEGRLEHGIERKPRPGKPRRFQTSTSASFPSATCFILTESGVQLARLSGLPAAEAPGNAAGRPRWCASLRELKALGKRVKRFKVPAPAQETILSSFEELRWPARIDDPLPPVPEMLSKRRLQNAIKSLNGCQVNALIRFRGDGLGKGVLWEWRDRPQIAPRSCVASDPASE
jgi:hypothetical protein